MTAVPRVSIGMPLYNAERFLKQAIESVLAQTFGDFELLIADNASTDRTVSICQMYADVDRRIRLIQREVNRGAIDNFNFVFHNSNGELFKWMSGDDVLHPDFLQKTVAALDADELAGWSYSEADMIDEGGASLLKRLDPNHPMLELQSSGRKWKGHPREHYLSKDPVARFAGVLLGSTWGIDSYGLMRRSVLLRTRMLEPLYGAEKVLMAEVNLYARAAYVDELLMLNRVHRGASGYLDSDSKRARFAAGKSGTPLSTRLRLLMAHCYSISRSPLSIWQKMRAYGWIGRYLLQLRKWTRIVAGLLPRYRHSDSRKMIESSNRAGTEADKS